jgi:hypothetical protein
MRLQRVPQPLAGLELGWARHPYQEVEMFIRPFSGYLARAFSEYL